MSPKSSRTEAPPKVGGLKGLQIDIPDEEEVKKGEAEVAQKHNIKTGSKGGLAVESTRYQSNGGLGTQANAFKSYSSRNSGTVAIELEQEAIPAELQPASRIIIPNHEPTKCSIKRNGIVQAYAANTNQGIVR